jgi:hypothetical protein
MSHCEFTSSRLKAAFLSIVLSLGIGVAHSQARQEVKYDYAPSQLTFVYQHTLDDYRFLELNGSEPRVVLNGATGEFAWRHYYPFEVVGRFTYAKGQPLGQALTSYTAGIGYTRRFYRRYDPFARFTAGFAHTSSTDYQYLYSPGNSGIALDLSGGLDVEVTHRFGVRAIEFENQYLPFGVSHQGSVYWSFGAGAYFRFGF